MLYREVAAHRKLRHLVKCFWMLDHDYANSFHDHEQLWADTHTELIFGAGHSYFRRSGARKIAVPPNFVIGPFQHDLELYSMGRTNFVAARFWPWGFHALSRIPMQELKNTVSSCRKTLGPAMESIGRRLAVLEGGDARIAELEQALLKAVTTIDAPRLHSRPMAEDIVNSRGVIRAGELARAWRIHPRRMERLFIEEIGVSAKVFARIVRFNHAKRAIERKPDIGLIWLAHECGYSDQSHFTRNFREMFGVTPSAFQSKVKEMMRRFAQERHDVVFVQDSAAQSE
jgi:AraC-like DNA-binding protein